MELGDEIRLDSHAPYLRIFDPLHPTVPVVTSALANSQLAAATASAAVTATGSSSDSDSINSDSIPVVGL